VPLSKVIVLKLALCADIACMAAWVTQAAVRELSFLMMAKPDLRSTRVSRQ